jgi:hypothetical protein
MCTYVAIQVLSGFLCLGFGYSPAGRLPVLGHKEVTVATAAVSASVAVAAEVNQ